MAFWILVLFFSIPSAILSSYLWIVVFWSFLDDIHYQRTFHIDTWRGFVNLLLLYGAIILIMTMIVTANDTETYSVGLVRKFFLHT